LDPREAASSKGYCAHARDRIAPVAIAFGSTDGSHLENMGCSSDCSPNKRVSTAFERFFILNILNALEDTEDETRGVPSFRLDLNNKFCITYILVILWGHLLQSDANFFILKQIGFAFKISAAFRRRWFYGKDHGLNRSDNNLNAKTLVSGMSTVFSVSLLTFSCLRPWSLLFC
jgi:hypothetical protein